jgi:hypothetical protein
LCLIGDGTTLYAACLTVYEEVNDPQGMLGIAMPEDEVAHIFMPKCLVLLSHYPYFETFRTILLTIYKSSISTGLSFSAVGSCLERIIDNFLCEAPMPVFSA